MTEEEIREAITDKRYVSDIVYQEQISPEKLAHFLCDLIEVMKGK
jgi:hypothetical protein